MLCACIDIGSNTTRLLVARVDGNRLEAVLQRRAFTRIGADTRATGALSPAKLDEVIDVVAGYRAEAVRRGAVGVRVVATAALRDAANREEALARMAARAGVDVELLVGEEEARLAFLGATRTLDHPLEGVVAVVDAGGGSTELAVGTMADGVRWSCSLRLGSGSLSDAHQRADPPSEAELRVMAAEAAERLAGAEVPSVDCAVAVGGSAASLRRLMGGRLDGRCMRDALSLLVSGPAERIAAELDLAVERVRLLPAGILILEAASRRLRTPLELASGGVREGVCLDAALRMRP